MNRNFKLVLFVAALMIHVGVSACEIKLEVNEKYKKESYKAQDVIVVDVKVVLDHRDCDVKIADTKITSSGAKIKGATKWKEVKNNVYTRKLKVQLEQSKDGESAILCKRSCDKDGGLGSLKIEVK